MPVKKACLLLLLLAASSVPSLSATEPPAGADPAAWALLEKWAGSEWVLDASWSSGEPLRARCVYTWGLGGKFLACKTFVSTGTSEYQRYETVIAWHPDKKSLVSIDMAFNGHLSETVMELVDKDTLRQGYVDYVPGHASPTRQEISFLDDDHHTWRVWVKSRSGEWTQIMDGVWRRAER
ncbi:hypothetical protein HS125_07000 [bacterium]|nr:hypothetical protein [bacterium]